MQLLLDILQWYVYYCMQTLSWPFHMHCLVTLYIWLLCTYKYSQCSYLQFVCIMWGWVQCGRCMKIQVFKKYQVVQVIVTQRVQMYLFMTCVGLYASWYSLTPKNRNSIQDNYYLYLMQTTDTAWFLVHVKYRVHTISWSKVDRF